MHLYNAWLPPPVVEAIHGEEEVMGEIADKLQRAWKPNDPKSKFATLKWISLINNLVRAKIRPAKPALDAVARLGFDVFFHSSDNLFVQVRWASCLSKLLSKYHKDITLELDWRKFYEMMLLIHFKRRFFFEGIALRQIHLESLVLLISNSRRFFRPGSASEIWAEFRPYLDTGIHNSSLEAVGFLSLFLPTKPVEPDTNVFTCDWFGECLRLWDGITDCPYWDRQWACLLGRFIKHRAYASPIDWAPFLPSLFGHFLNMFEVPVAKSDATPPIEREVPYDLRLAFNGNWKPAPKNVAKAIVYLIQPEGSAQDLFEQLVDLLEQYYHPSNGGSWTSSLEQFLRHLSYFFIKRLSYEQQHNCQKNFLGPDEREAFVKTIVRLIERGQYSKSGRLAVTSSNVASGLAFVAPSVILPFIVSRFEAAMITVTATHQLESALTTLALASRAVLLSENIDTDLQMEADTSNRLDFSFNLSFVDCKTTLVEAMFTTLLGIDANDPPKTLATVQFYASVVANVGSIGEITDGGSSVLSMDWSQWLDEFLSRLFVLLRHVESGTHTGDINLGEGSHKSSSTFLMQEHSLYSTLIELLFGRLTRPLFQQAMKKVAKFAYSNILPGAVTEMGLLCSALVYANPVETVSQVLLPIMKNVLNTLTDVEATGSASSSSTQADTKVNLSPATETSVSAQLTLLCFGMMNAGPALLQCQDVLKRIIASCFKLTSAKVNEAGERFLSSVVESLLLYYPLQQYRSCSGYPGHDGIESWISTKEPSLSLVSPMWHLPSEEEVAFAEEVIQLHLRNALLDLRSLCEMNSVPNKEKLRILLLQINGSLKGARSALPDFTNESSKGSLRIAGKTGASVGNSKLREEAADTLIKACEYLLKAKADDTALLILLVQSLDLVGNYGSPEYNEWSHGKHTWKLDSKNLVEPRVNFITGIHSAGKRRPYWMMTEMVYLHNTWRASQAGYRHFERNEVCPYVVKVATELLKLSLHSYDEVRDFAGASLKKMLKRYPPLVKSCMPTLASSLQDADAMEHSALGSCSILASRPVLRHIAQDWKSLAMFIQAVLGSSRHSSVKAQTAISELAIAFSVRFGGVPLSGLDTEANDALPNYSQLLSLVKDSSDGDIGAVHWRYKLMAHVGMLCLVLPLDDTDHAAEILETRKFLAGEFINALGSDLPSLRPLSVIALLLLLRSGHYKIDRNATNFSLEDALTPVFQQPSFASRMVKNLSLDHHYSEGQGRSRGARVQAADLSVIGMMPAFVRQWPTTRNWVVISKGEAFSPKLAKLFKRLVQECGSGALEALRGPLEDAVNASEEKTMQCMAAEILAGLLHSDVRAVVEAWGIWLSDLLHKALMQANPESLAEWAACVRFSSTGKGRKGLRAPLLRQAMFEGLMTRQLPSTASSNLVSKRLQYLLSVVMELRPEAATEQEINVQLNLLVEVMEYMANPSSQVRQNVGKIMCVLCTNLQDARSSPLLNEKDVPDWKTSLLNGTVTATAKIQKSLENTEAAGDLSSNTDVQEAVKYMETVFQFLIAAMASGRASYLMPVLVGALPSVLALQETSHKDMSFLAKLAVFLYKWQPFGNEYRTKAVGAIASAANDSNWRTRLSALTFSQSFAYRHAFTLEKEEVTRLWNCVQNLLSDSQLEVRETASTTLSGMLKGPVSDLPVAFREGILSSSQKNMKLKSNRGKASDDKIVKHGIVMGLRACVLSAPYDIPRWLPDIIFALAKFTHEPSPISNTVRKTIAEFRRTHADTWAYQKNYFSEEQLEVLADLSSSTSYFA
ncbi:proteasome activator subunit 4 [Selaginella moellendorffii]|uniref:proteasome activator subunit 4 n=1 Tax=Selaginella moellendorffii TaxID=88036 RepID=UPI000D1C8FA5|nr:proteasome activator subunit 4 [Selaginella moellendorffii]|eukprot:XP_024522024.1 proteasome activator subunit 4 [Selaginella moellendorffii]